jgi:hypothetical protein
MRLHANYLLPYEPCSTVCRDAETRRRSVKQGLLQREFELGIREGGIPLLVERGSRQTLDDSAPSITAH